MKQRFLVALLTLTMIPLSATAQRTNRPPRSGTLTDAINRTDSDINGLFSVWLRVKGKMYEFRVAKARVIGGSKSDLKEGIPVQISYRWLSHSEMDDFYTSEAVTITIQKADRNSKVAKPNRLIALTDIEADPDDTQSLIRLLLYSNVIDIQGLIATTSVHQKSFVAPDSILKLVIADS